MRYDLAAAIRELAVRTNANVGEAKWYWFGSTRNNLSDAADIDLVVVCENHTIADEIRRLVDSDQLTRPIHLSILTQEEEAEVHFVKSQGCTQIL
jgi:hypothetical protein